MKILVALVLLCSMQTVRARPVVYSGVAARYSKGTMLRVARNRGIEPQYCMISSTYEPIGTWVTVTSKVTGATLDCLTIDVPQERHRASIISRGIIAEVSYSNALEICGSRRKAPRDCPISIRR